MKTSHVLAAAGLLALSVAGCSSDSDTPDPGALATSIKGLATTPAAAPSSSSSPSDSGGGSGSGDCSDAPPAARAALAGMSVTDVSMLGGCTAVYIKTAVTDPEVGRSMCEKVAGEVYQLGVRGIAVESDTGISLAVGAPGADCHAL